MEKMRQWAMLTVVGVIAVVAAGWFLLVSPQKSHAADLRAQTSTQQSANATLQSEVARLEQQKKGLPAQQKLLSQIATKIPATPELPTLIRQLSKAAKGAGVDLVSLAPAQPATVAASAPAPVAPAPSTAPGATAAAPAVAAASPLAQIPVTVTVSGSYYNVTSFFHALEKLSRALRVTQFSLEPAGADGGGSGGSAAAAPDALTGTLSAVVFESPEAAAPAQTTPVAPSAQSTTAPAAAS